MDCSALQHLLSLFDCWLFATTTIIIMQGVRNGSTSRAVRVSVSCSVEPKKILMMGEKGGGKEGGKGAGVGDM